MTCVKKVRPSAAVDEFLAWIGLVPLSVAQFDAVPLVNHENTISVDCSGVSRWLRDAMGTQLCQRRTGGAGIGLCGE